MTHEFGHAVSMEMWKLADELSVLDAAILITGNDPSAKHTVHDLEVDMSYLEQTTTGHKGFDAAFNALRSAILANKLRARVVFPVDVDPSRLSAVVRAGWPISELSGQLLSQCADAVILQREPDWKQTTVEVEELKRWLRSRNSRPPFFFPLNDIQPKPRAKVRDYMDPSHLRYSGKLACAVAAWEALSDLPENRPTIQAIRDWVTRHGERYRVGSGGKVPKNALEQIAKVVNWKLAGGAPKTGGQVSGKPTQDPHGTAESVPQKQKMQPFDGEDEEPPFL
ncbi:hypothetical protein [Sinorhizobium meliloti]|uniref:Uncharacterized protein n=1 Tax=Rhizobium meliloti (strain 1021) TaxID=266834 RepID=Q92SB6_RHIME|nr:hypothetical protein [Sinorhizobium meliloti]AGG73073.1 Hypothetical protein SM2011_c02202 [Sinorhizobium meliloti 2011]ASP57820.1 hypothetical protein CDO30_05510 [Sinorhizobium meliloti]MCK3802810.1 hypothetical protein [Sinorhizobium meliloti]MCK3808670.1 hypothetical protein [Sinorhizobium meliloti]MCK3813439.1 hypothetical protein [Sinorhizobium meliloti]